MIIDPLTPQIFNVLMCDDELDSCRLKSLYVELEGKLSDRK
jgi:hypothetical protein